MDLITTYIQVQMTVFILDWDIYLCRAYFGMCVSCQVSRGSSWSARPKRKIEQNEDKRKHMKSSDIESNEDKLMAEEEEEATTIIDSNPTPVISSSTTQIKPKSKNSSKRVSFADSDPHSSSSSEDEDDFKTTSDPLYDEHADERDEKWVSRKHVDTVSGSDAVLSCPACFTIVCYDCQRHEYYSTQFRAMFVENVRVLHHHTVRPIKGDEDPTQKFYVVVCNTCSTQVGVVDEEEIYHLHHVLEANP